ncbi:S8 family serine peptidase [Terribacillus saccharophilus]|uniref:S8 family peptidase n=1 Tax=Terribacillus saccharophilus TaxID=361277 RepID=UPI003982A2BA
MNKFLMKQSIFALLLVGLVFQLPIENVYAEEEKQMVVVYENELGEKAVEASGAAIEEQYDHLSAAAIAADTAAIDKLKNDPDIKYVEPDSKIRIAENNDVQSEETAVFEQWNLGAVGAPAAWQEGLTGKGVKIAIMDSGIAAHHDLQVAGGISTVDYTTSFEDDEGHGTHVAGIIGAKHDEQGIDGIAPDADLFAVKVLDDTGEGYLSDLLEGIDWAISNDMDIINLSMGTADESDALEEAMQRAYQADILLVAASGNEGAGYPVDYPAAYDSVIAVSATDSENNIAAFSSVGEKVEFSAPGKNIISTLTGSDYGIMSGTSQATSHVSALFAILKQQFPADTNEQLRIRMQQYTKDLGEQARDHLYGYGLIQYPAPVQKEELLSNDSEGSESGDTGDGVKEEKVTTEELRILANELELTIEELADLFAAYGFNLYNYHNLYEVNDVIYQNINEVSVYFLLEKAGLDREQLDRQLAAEGLTLADFNTPEELSAYIKELEQHSENGENQAGMYEGNVEESNTTPDIPVTDDQNDEKPVNTPVVTDSAKKEKVDLGTVEQASEKKRAVSGNVQQVAEPNSETDEITFKNKSSAKSDLDDEHEKHLPDTASPIGNMIAAGVMLAAAGLLLYIRS